MIRLFVFLFCILCFDQIYGQSKGFIATESTIKHVKIDSIQIRDSCVLNEIHKTIVPFLICKQYNPKDCIVYLIFTLNKNYTFCSIEISVDKNLKKWNNYEGYCIIDKYEFVLSGKEAYKYIKKTNGKAKEFYIDDDLIPVTDGCISWLYYIIDGQILLISHVEEW